MNPEVLKPKLAGVHAFPITPFGPDGEVNLRAVRENATWLARSGVATLVAPSGTGELFGLSPDEILAVVAATVEAVDGRVPVIAGVGFGSRTAARLARQAQEVGADGLLVLPPYYAHPDAEGLAAYYAEIACATDLGMIIYARDSANIPPALLAELAEDIPGFIALKDGRGDLRLFQRLRGTVGGRLGPDRLVWLAGVGDDMVAPYFAAGAQGYTSSLACFWPEIAVQMLELAQKGDFKELARLQSTVVRPFYELRQRRGGFEVAVIKAAMECLGYSAGPVRPPLANLSDADLRDLRAILTRLQVPSAAERQNAAALTLSGR